ncbi:polysaccharide deacetylase family protein [Natronoglomus mannanivorans]|uniref:Polysaccharide deacetylase n=1 Tax=Natronoglomus mannanivorans TaxID=2979990 RepID=A0AAP3E2R2_9EURY|nr:hypothetical protein [Halobacteria archaeon AArc-xg1-1]
MTMTNRRSFLTAASSIGAASLAGCLADVNVLDESGEAETLTDSGADPDENSSADPNETESESDDEPDSDESTDELDHLPGETIVDFEDLDSWIGMAGQGRIVDEDDDVYAGSRSARITAEEGIDYAATYRTYSDGLDLNGKNLSLAVKYMGRDQFDLTVQLLAPNSQNVLSFRRSLTGPADAWQRVDLGVNAVDTQPDLQNVQEIRIIGRRRGDESGDIEFLVDDLRAVDRPDRGAVLLLFDATLESHYTTAFEIAEEFGYPGVEAVIPEAVGESGRLTLDQMRELDDAGWDMAARPRTGAQFLHEFSTEQQEGLIRRTKAYLENRGFEDGARHFVTPKNLVQAEAMEFVREYHEQAFRFGGAPNTIPTSDAHNLGTFGGTGSATRHFVDMAARYNQLAVLRFEGIGADGFDEGEFRELLEYIDEKDVDVVSASDLLERDA